MSKPRDWLDPVVVVADDEGTEFPRRRVLQFSGVRVTDDEANDTTHINAEPPSIDTTNATPVYVTLATLELGEVRQVDVLVKVAKSDGAVRQSFKLAALVYGDTGPTATIDGGVEASSLGTGTADATIDVNGADVRLKITGIAATDLTTTYEAHVL